MSEGDVIRLNRMYKCGSAYNTGDNPKAQPKPTSKSENENENENRNHESKSTTASSLFGMFIFKIISGN